MIGGNAKVLVNRVDQPLRLVAFVGNVDPLLAGSAGDRDPEISGKRKNSNL